MPELTVSTLGGLEDARAYYLRHVTRRIDQARSQLVVASPAQQAAYAAKLEEANAVMREDALGREYPWIANECAARGEGMTLGNVTMLAQRIIRAHHDTEQRNMIIEASRITAQEIIRRAGDVATMQQALAQMEQNLNDQR